MFARMAGLSSFFLLISTGLPGVFAATTQAQAAVTFYTDEAAWTAAVDATAVDAFDTTPANVAQADELGGAPVQDEQLGAQLTFRAANTALCGGFTLHALEPGAVCVLNIRPR
jgi:hypothetical protein